MHLTFCFLRPVNSVRSAQWTRHWSAVLVASQEGQHTQLEPDVGTVFFDRGPRRIAAKKGPKTGANFRKILIFGRFVIFNFLEKELF